MGDLIHHHQNCKYFTGPDTKYMEVKVLQKLYVSSQLSTLLVYLQQFIEHDLTP